MKRYMAIMMLVGLSSAKLSAWTASHTIRNDSDKKVLVTMEWRAEGGPKKAFSGWLEPKGQPDSSAHFSGGFSDISWQVGDQTDTKWASQLKCVDQLHYAAAVKSRPVVINWNLAVTNVPVTIRNKTGVDIDTDPTWNDAKTKGKGCL